MKVWEKRKKLDCSHSLKAFLFTIARNLAFDHLRSAKGVRPLTDIHEDSTPNPAQAMEEHECKVLLRTYLNKSIQDLPERQQEAFVLHRYRGLSYEEIAVVMGITRDTVKGNIRAAMVNLALHLQAFKSSSGCNYP